MPNKANNNHADDRCEWCDVALDERNSRRLDQWLCNHCRDRWLRAVDERNADPSACAVMAITLKDR